MPVAVQLDFEGATLEQYSQGLATVGLLPGGPGPKGQILHVAIETDNGIRAIDVWESRELYEAFASSQILPVSQEVGMPSPPTIQLFDVVSLFTAGQWRN